jgi:hypothetical protein
VTCRWDRSLEGYLAFDHWFLASPEELVDVKELIAELVALRSVRF